MMQHGAAQHSAAQHRKALPPTAPLHVTRLDEAAVPDNRRLKHECWLDKSCSMEADWQITQTRTPMMYASSMKAGARVA